MRRILILCLCCLLMLSNVACKTPDILNGSNAPGAEDDAKLNISACYTKKLDTTEEITNYVQFEMEGGATFIIQLFPEFAPKTVAHFQSLVSEDFYDGLTFHRILKGTCIYGGDPKGNGTGSADCTIEGEFVGNGFTQNTLSHIRGTISMLHGLDPNSASCQFFIAHQNVQSYDGKYAAFGRIICGMETIDAIADLTVIEQPLSGEMSKPVSAPVIKSVSFVTADAVATLPEANT